MLQCATLKFDITPSATTPLTGDVYRRRYGEKVHSPLYCRMLLLDDGSKRLCIVACDVTIITDEPADRIRKALASITGSVDNVMVHATQTHNAPSLGSDFMLDKSIPLPPEAGFLRGTPECYVDMVIEKVIENARKLSPALKPVKMFSGRAVEGRYSFNRRGVFMDNGIFMPGNGWRFGHPDEYMRGIDGPIDPEVAVIGFCDENNRTVAMLLHHTCHPVCTFPQNMISSDWPGAWCSEVEKLLPEGATAITLNGCCGNINPWDPYDPEPISDCAEMSAALSDAVRRVIERNGGELKEGFIDADVKTVELDFRKPEPEEIGQRLEYYKENPDVVWKEPGEIAELQWVFAANNTGLLNYMERKKKFRYTLQLFRIGDCAIMGMPGEPFVEAQLKLKQVSPAAVTFCVHNINQYVGYIPVPSAFEYPAGRRGHEANFSVWSKLERNALNIITATAEDMLAKNFKN